jgi:hypothetical protein
LGAAPGEPAIAGRERKSGHTEPGAWGAFAPRHRLTQEATELGWQIPPAARIPVALSGTRDAVWALEEDEQALCGDARARVRGRLRAS